MSREKITNAVKSNFSDIKEITDSCIAVGLPRNFDGAMSDHIRAAKEALRDFCASF